jgi:hypothetical protein
MDRRRFLTGTIAATTAATAGCLGILDDGGSSRSEPESTVVEFYAAIDEGDAERARELLHDESPEAENMALSGFGDVDLSIESTELVEESESRATVEYTLVIESSGGSEEVTNEHELRKQDGEWRIWS